MNRFVRPIPVVVFLRRRLPLEVFSNRPHDRFCEPSDFCTPKIQLAYFPLMACTTLAAMTGPMPGIFSHSSAGAIIAA